MKNIKLSHILYTALLVSQVSNSFANESGPQILKLEDAIGMALKDSPAIKKSSSVNEEMNWRKVDVRSDLLPKVNFLVSHTFDIKYENVPFNLGNQALIFPLTTPRTSYGGEATWTIFNGLGNWNNYQAAKLDSLSAQSELSRKVFETKKEVELAYYNVIAAVKLSEVAKQNVKSLNESNERAKAKYKNGAATQYETLRVEVQLSEAEAEVEKSEDNIIIARKNLVRLLGKKELDFETYGDLPEPSAIAQVKSLASDDIQNRDDIKAARLKMEAAEKRESGARGLWSPSVSLFSRYERYDNTTYKMNFNSNDFRDAYSVGVMLKWSLFDGGSTYAKPYIANAQYEAAAATLEEAVVQTPRDFELWKRRYLYSARFYETRKADVVRSTESLRIASSAFNQGSKTINDVLDAESDLFKARAGIVKAQIEAQEALTKLELTLGKEI